ncbi:MAG: coproporphyrinogen dehydrogenase HemZ [Tyzzerella sp.]|nr:coproporphyrinogen dehydrogenase HemZ [Tyzzerella sp.]
MIRITVQNEVYVYDMYHITKAFWPAEVYEQIVDETSEDTICIEAKGYARDVFIVHPEEVANIEERKLKKRYVNLKLYDWLCKNTNKELAWGILTGVRPTKLMMTLLESGMSKEEVKRWMKENYRITEEKAELGIQVAKKEKALLEQLDYKDGFSLYVGIPFCPTICSYCSFSSYPIEIWKKSVDEYLDAVCKELTFISEMAKQKQKKLNTVYIGGGTPTTLEPEQLDRLLTHLETHFSYADLKEITVEAGRPDSITKEKLEVLKAHHIGRISINPQTMQQKTLNEIGRRHTVEDIRRVYTMAREIGFDNINMDLIAGLPGETVEDMQDTLEQIKEMAPDSLTVHALAMKRASRLTREQKERQAVERKQQGRDAQECDKSDPAQENSGRVLNAVEQDAAQIADNLSRMIDMAADYAKDMDLAPYYLYRQKNIAGNFENVGYAKVDKAGIYNILIMEEKQSIIAVGAGASTKIVVPNEQAVIDPKTGNKKNIVRTENVKDVEQYINRIDEMIERKGEWLWH